MRKIIFIITLISCSLLLSSCSDYLNIIPEGVASMDNAFSNRANAEKYLHTCYSYLPRVDEAGSALGFLAADEHWLIPKGTGLIWHRVGMSCWEIGRGAQNSNEPFMNYWDGANGAGRSLWQGIYDCNVFLENIDRPKDLQEAERVRWKSEVMFLKAYYHFFLFQLYGPIPILDENIEVNAPLENIRTFRDPVDTVVDYIIELIDKSMINLPPHIINEALELGRITQSIAAATKAQVLLYAASPLMNGNPDYTGVIDKKGDPLFTQAYDSEKWKRAADAAKEAIIIAEKGGHVLYTFDDAIKMSDITRRIMSIGGAVTERWNKEIIWGSTTDVNSLQTLAMTKIDSKRNHMNARSLLAPTLQIAEQFYSNNGVPIEEDKGSFWEENYPNRYSVVTIPDEGVNKHILEVGGKTALLHLNRESRFYSNISFDRGAWYMSGFANDTTDLCHPHFFTQEYSGFITTEDYSITGYLNKKVISMKSSLTDEAWSPYRYSFPIIRLADLYLMYAEALNESLASPNEEVYLYIDKVRERAGLKGVIQSWEEFSKFPTKPTTKEGLRDIIHKERLNELALEGKRFWDLRRWKKELPSIIRGWNIKGKTPEDFYRVTVIFDRPKFSYREYLWPIRVSTMQRNPNLTQNPGWN